MPNPAVDVNSWAGSACYPRSTFYPLSNGPSIQCRRITKTCFRTCSARRPHSQAPFCLYTLRLISDQPEGTFVCLRYLLGGDHPSQTAHQTLSRWRFHSTRLEFQHSKVGIPRAAPPELAPWLPSLPTILYMLCRNPMPSCSKGSQGLSVFLRVPGVCTRILISPSPLWRQCPSRYAIRAGRNLPDKEFRYLRTVIVTAAVYRGLSSVLRRS